MSRNNILLLLLILAIAGAAYFATTLDNDDENNSGNGICDISEQKMKDKFVVSDTAHVDKVVITSTKGEKVTVSRKKGTYTWQFQNETYNSETKKWEAGELMAARQDAIELLLKTFYRVELKNYVANTAKETITEQVSAAHKQVDIYINGQLEKTWYVGMPTKDHYGTYMILGLPDCGKSKWPFIMGARNFHGSLWPRFFVEEADWRHTGIWNMNPADLATVEVKNYTDPSQSFSINLKGQNEFSLFDPNGNSVPKFDTLKVQNYMAAFRKIHYEKYADDLDPLQKDSLIKTGSMAMTIKTVDKSGDKISVDIYQRKLPEGSKDLAEQEISYDTERAYGVLHDGRVVLLQYYVFNKLIVPFNLFAPQP